MIPGCCSAVTETWQGGVLTALRATPMGSVPPGISRIVRSVLYVAPPLDVSCMCMRMRGQAPGCSPMRLGVLRPMLAAGHLVFAIVGCVRKAEDGWAVQVQGRPRASTRECGTAIAK